MEKVVDSPSRDKKDNVIVRGALFVCSCGMEWTACWPSSLYDRRMYPSHPMSNVDHRVRVKQEFSSTEEFISFTYEWLMNS